MACIYVGLTSNVRAVTPYYSLQVKLTRIMQRLYHPFIPLIYDFISLFKFLVLVHDLGIVHDIWVSYIHWQDSLLSRVTE